MQEASGASGSCWKYSDQRNYIRLAMKCTAVGAVWLFTMFARFSGRYWHNFIPDSMGIEKTLHKE
jgi:hypothetical protein